MSLPRLTYLVIAIGAGLWCALLALPPVLVHLSGSPGGAADLIASLFRPICHQLEGRSVMLLGHPMAVCSRCSAIYVAFFAGTLVYPFLRKLDSPVMPPRWFLLLALAPMVLDVLAGLLGLHEVTLSTRIWSGALFGLAAPFIILPAAIEGAVQLISRPAVHQQKGFSDARQTQ